MLKLSSRQWISWIVRDTPFRAMEAGDGVFIQLHGIINGCISAPSSIEQTIFSDIGFNSVECACDRFPAVVDRSSKNVVPQDNCKNHACPAKDSHVFTLCASPLYCTHVLKKQMGKFNNEVFQQMESTRGTHCIARIMGVAHCPFSSSIDAFALLRLAAQALENGATEIILCDLAGSKDQQYYTVALRTLIAGGIPKDIIIWEANDCSDSGVRSVHTAIQGGITKFSCEILSDEYIQSIESSEKTSNNRQSYSFRANRMGLPKGGRSLDVRSVLEFASFIGIKHDINTGNLKRFLEQVNV